MHGRPSLVVLDPRSAVKTERLAVEARSTPDWWWVGGGDVEWGTVAYWWLVVAS